MTFKPGDIVVDTQVDPTLQGVVCRLIDGAVQVFLAEGPDMDSYSCGVYPAEWLTLVPKVES
jgi:hypothetical protein